MSRSDTRRVLRSSTCPRARYWPISWWADVLGGSHCRATRARCTSPMAWATTLPSSTPRAEERPFRFPSAGCPGAWRSMIRTLLEMVTACAAGWALAQTVPEAPPPRMTIAVVDILDDQRYEPIRAYERLVLKDRAHPFAGAQVGMADAQALSRVLRVDFALERISVNSSAEITPAVVNAV